MSSVYSWSKFGGRALAAAAGHEENPVKLIFVVTKRCHSKCVYCDIWKAKDTPGGLDQELTLSEIDAFAANNSYLQWIDFTGGEPTDRPDFVELIEAFSKHCPDLLLVHFPTNGIATRRISDVARSLTKRVRARLVVTVSIDGPPELNDRLRGIRNDFGHAINTFVELRRILGPENTFVGLTLHAYSKTSGISSTALVQSTSDAVNAALAVRSEKPIGWETLHLNIPHVSEHYYGNTERVEASDGFGSAGHRAEIASALEFAAAQKKAHGSLGMRLLEKAYRKEALRYLSSGRTTVTCSALQMTAYLSEKGEVYPCTIWNKPLGNIRDHAFRLAPILAKARENKVRQAIRQGNCPKCWTPCEAYPALLSSPLRSTQLLLSA